MRRLFALMRGANVHPSSSCAFFAAASCASHSFRRFKCSTLRWNNACDDCAALPDRERSTLDDRPLELMEKSDRGRGKVLWCEERQMQRRDEQGCPGQNLRNCRSVPICQHI